MFGLLAVEALAALGATLGAGIAALVEGVALFGVIVCVLALFV